MSLETGEVLFEGFTHPAKRPTPRGIEVLNTPSLDLPSGIPVEVHVEHDPKFDTGQLSLFSANIELARVAPLRAGMHLMIRLSSDEVLWVQTSSN